jgi:hypothetical protein
MPRQEQIPETQYATLGDDQIAYQVFGEGEVDLLWVPPSGDCVDLRWDYPAYADFCCGSAPRRGSSRSIGEELEPRTPPRERLSPAGNAGQTTHARYWMRSRPRGR